MNWRRVRLLCACVLIALTAACIAVVQLFPSMLDWPDRRPIGSLFLASNFHKSPSNPRGWLNDPGLDVSSPQGRRSFREAILAYADRSIRVLKSVGAQGMIVWDVEGEEFPHKITYVGDPRRLGDLAPEMAGLADEFFSRFRAAGLRVGLTIRPQKLERTASGEWQQTNIADYHRELLEKIRYARKRWGATLFYIDSNGGMLWPAEAWRLRSVVAAEPGVLLIPEYQQPLHYAFSAPYDAVRQGTWGTPRLVRWLYPGAFTVLNVADVEVNEWSKDALRTGCKRGDVLLFPAWFNSREADIVAEVARGR